MPGRSALAVALCAVAALIMGIAACGADPSAPAPAAVERDAFESIYMQLGSCPDTEPEWLPRVAEFDGWLYTADCWAAIGGERDSLMLRRPKGLAGSYFCAGLQETWMRPAAERGEGFSFGGDLWLALSPYLVWTTEGDTASWYDANVPPLPPKPDCIWDWTSPAARAAAAAVVARWLGDSDWLMIDHFSPIQPRLWVEGSRWRERVHGDVDFDRDGIGYWEDEDEQQLVRDAQVDIVAALRRALPRMLLIPNGSRAIKDPQFARLVDGCYVEAFPLWHFGSEAANWDAALDPTRPNSLFDLCRPGRWHPRSPGYVMLEDRNGSGMAGWCAGLFEQAVEVVRRRTLQGSPGPLRPDLGAPTGPAARSGDRITRTFENGTLDLQITANGVIATVQK